MRKKLIAGNWKMNGSRSQAQALVAEIRQGLQAVSGVDVVILPSFVHLSLTENLLANSTITWGAQNLYVGTAGAFTGEVSGLMLVDYGCRYVLVGHSERRSLFHDDLILVAAKFKAALEAKLQPILCVGETLDQREKNLTEAVIAEQLTSVINTVGIAAFETAVIAYEPVWAIGTGLSATPDQAQAVHAFIRKQIGNSDKNIANSLKILYGGSVKQDNAAGLFAMPDIDGGLLGGAALNAQIFIEICKLAKVPL